ncbi:MAG TPA: hypothetical protein VFG20_23085 [Planctomycetaceae bacterium]|nr:hypothetical protein [Planctomycetaceae bacterium]
MRWLVVILSVGLGLFGAEVAMRVAGLDFASPYQPDPCCGSRLNANAGFWHLSEGRAYITTNSAGFRDREHAVQKPPGTLRIAVLGDSFAEALQIEARDAFWAVLERELSKCDKLDGRAVEVLNFGVSGFGTTQELQLLRHHVWRYDPDIVLLAFLPGNDVRNNSRELEWEQQKPFYNFVDGQLVLDESFRDQRMSPTVRVKDWLVRHVRVLSAIYRAKENLKTAGRQTTIPQVEAGLDDHAFAPPQDEKWQRAWAITEGVIGLMHDEVRAHGAEFFVVGLNNAIQVHPDPDVMQAAAQRLGTDDVDEPDRRLARVAAQRGFDYFSLTPPMRTIAQRDKIFFHGFRNTSPGSGHWNEQGHKTAGELIATALCESKLLGHLQSTK